MFFIFNTNLFKLYLKKILALPKHARVISVSKETIHFEINGEKKCRVYQNIFASFPIVINIKRILFIAVGIFTKGMSCIGFGFILSTDTTATNNADTWIRSNIPNTNLEGADLKVGYRGSLTDRILIRFTLPAGSGTISKIALFLKLQGYDEADNMPCSIHECSRTFVENQATWNSYSTGNTWTTAGGDYSATKVDVTTIGSSTGSFYEWDLVGGTSDNPISGLTWESVINLLIKRETESGSTTTKNFYTKGDATVGNRPYIEITYTAISAPTVTTQAVSQITNTTATGNGNVTADGGAEITQRGVCVSESVNPTTDDDTFISAGTTGAFTADITGLTIGTHYHVRAYAINSEGTSYGADVEFDTLETPSELRDFTNKPGATYDANKTTVIYAEDMANIKEWIEYLASNL
jgi:hypothetical protein